MNLAKRTLLGAGAAYLATAVAAARISVRDDLPAEPLGITTGLEAHRDLLRGTGTALCAPAAMLVALGVALIGAGRAAPHDRRPVAILTGLGAGFLAGIAAGPVAREVVADPRAHPDRTAVVAMNLVLPALMMGSGLRHLVQRDRVRGAP